MIQAFSIKYQKHVAAFFLYILIAELCLPLAYGAGGYYTPGTGKYKISLNSATPFITGFSSSRLAHGLKGNPTENGLPTKIQLTEKQKQVKKTKPVFDNKTVNSSGPSQPEMQSFQSVNSSNMVDLFTGDFSYSIPLLDAGGYPVNIHYKSGISMDQEASWVGLGWNINPGTISRNMRGIPDDFSGEQIEKTFSIRPNWTAGVNAGANPEIFGKLKNILGANAGIFYNNYRGIGLEAGISASLSSGKGSKGAFTGGLSIGDNSQSGVTITPSFGVKVFNVDKDGVFGAITGGFSASAAISTRAGLQSLSITGNGRRAYGYWAENGKGQMESQVAFATGSQTFSPITFAHHAYTPTINLPYTSYDYSFSLQGGGEIFGLHPLGSLSIYYSRQYIETKSMSLAAYGYLNLQKGSADEAALLDFNREKELTYHESPATPHLAVPNYTYDVYAISGEGTGGMFRPYRGDIGFVRDHVMQTKSTSAGGGIDLGVGNLYHGGADIRYTDAATKSNGWIDNNELARQITFKDADSTFENVYFKNPSEKTINTQDFYNSLGGDKVLAPVMTNSNDPSLTPMVQPYKNYSKSGALIRLSKTSTVKKSRDKRSQVISYLNAGLASLAGLEKTISVYPVNKYFIGKCDLKQCDEDNPFTCSRVVSIARNSGIRRPNHLSEITVLNADGRRYVYGLPVYNLEQDDVTFSVYKSNADANTGLVGYTPGSENEVNNNRAGKENFYSKEKIPAYAHSFLLTAVVSPDYMDRLQDGITDDDQGDAVKFDYSRLYDDVNPYQWRVPFNANKAQYNEALKTDNSDDKGSYSYGKKEVWYLNAVQSKTMVATFTLNDPANGEVRQDGYGVMGENGGINTGSPLRYLKEINLYSKSDYLQNRGNATPVKTVHFAYSYRLCTGAPGSLNGRGKLTLDSIWFTYNGNEKGRLNPYVFNYHNNNPYYNIKSYDRWGNYKSAADNPARLSNADYPYSLQNGINNWDSAKAASNAGAWNLANIQLPSGGKMQVDYESDDYAYVQNVRAGEMMQLAGFGSSNNFDDANNAMYDAYGDKPYVFINVPFAAESIPEVYKKYLQGIKKLYFNYRVEMRSDIYGGGYEHVSTYARFSEYGFVPGKNIIWVHLQSSGGLFFESPLAATAIQTLKLNLPSKAYPNSDLNGDADPVALGKALVGFLFNLSELLSNFSARSRILSWAREVDTERSFVRLHNPDYKKLGGGFRVKRITISDNWNAMTGQKEATYGQEYDYSTVKEIDGKATRISSGVASYEPLIGNEENPLRQPIEYEVQVAPLGPTQNYYSETPLGEGYYPSASVGYSKVRVHTIHKDVQSANGYEETEFYTTYDFPVITECTPLEEQKFKPSVLSQMFRINTKRFLTQTQGFKVELNDMNGKEKATASYPEHDPHNALAYTKYYYKVDDENASHKHLYNMVPVADSAGGHVSIASPVGKDVEIMVDLREQNSQTKGGALEFNMDGFILGIFPISIPSVWPVPQFEENRYRSAAIMKLVQRYGIVDKVVHYEKGSLVTTQNELYDAETGDVLLTRTQNEFDDPVYNFSYPAHWAYTGMGPAYKNINAVFNGLQFTNGKIVSAPPSYGDIERFFESGDELLVWANDKTGSNSPVNTCSGEGECITPGYRGYQVPQKLWAIDASKIQNANTHIAQGIYFIDTLGSFFNSADANGFAQIIRSGKRNMAATAVGAVTSLASPLRKMGGKWKLVFDDATKVLNAAASAYKDFWAVEDAKFELKTIVVSKLPAVSTLTFTPEAASLFSIAHTRKLSSNIFGCHVDSDDMYAYTNTDYIEAATHNEGSCDDEHSVRSWMKFNIGAIPDGASIIDAKLNLFPHLANHNQVNLEENNHNNGHPHFNESYDDVNEAMIYNEANNAINTTSISALQNNADATVNLFNGSSPINGVSATVMATVKQNSYIISKGMADVARQMYAKPGKQSYLAFVMKGPVVEGGPHKRLCFWSKDNCQDPAYSKIVNQNILPHAGGGIEKEYSSGSSAINPACFTAPRLTVTYVSCQNGYELTEQCDTFYCIKRVPTDTCLSYITDTSINPYRFGILGNWRMNKGYTYYNTRKEVNPLAQTDIRKNGMVTDFHPYWTFGTSAISPSTDTIRWVWNSELTLFNRKGFEIENKDPLGRYNSAQYGYKQTLPVAVTQNAHYREQAFDGFEDYGYDNDLCANTCPLPRHLDFNGISAKLTGAEAHTGKFSLVLNAGNSVNADIQVTDTLQQSPALYFKIDTTIIPRLQFSDGYGMKATYYGGYHYETDNDGLENFNNTQGSISPVVYHKRNVFYSIEYPFHDVPHVYMQRYEENNIVSTPNAQYYKVVWEGTMVARETKDYIFQVKADNAIKVWIGGKLVVNAYPNDPVYYGGENTLFSEPMKFIRGKIYDVRVEHLNGTSSGYAYLYWHRTSESYNAFVPIPVNQLFESTGDAVASISSKDTTCLDWQGIRSLSKDILIKEFSPVKSTKFLVGAWVKEDKDCHCQNYQDASIEVSFFTSYGSLISTSLLKPSGNIIEGWQRIEDYVTIPTGTVKMRVSLKSIPQNNYNGKVYFDDLRIHPFNANMKSYVYDPLSLRLMADLDENNYASFYEYDDDGTLIRVKKETERGIKTIKESRSALLKP